MYRSHTPVSPAAAAANAIRASIMVAAHKYAKTWHTSTRGTSYPDFFKKALVRVWAERKVAVARQHVVTQRRQAGKVAFLRDVNPMLKDNCRVSRVVSYNAYTKEKEFVVLDLEQEYMPDTSGCGSCLNFVAKANPGVYLVVDENNSGWYYRVTDKLVLGNINLDDIPKTVPATKHYVHVSLKQVLAQHNSRGSEMISKVIGNLVQAEATKFLSRTDLVDYQLVLDEVAERYQTELDNIFRFLVQGATVTQRMKQELIQPFIDQILKKKAAFKRKTKKENILVSVR